MTAETRTSLWGTGTPSGPVPTKAPKTSRAFKLPGATQQPASESRQEDTEDSRQGRKQTARPGCRSPPETPESKHPHSGTRAELLERRGDPGKQEGMTQPLSGFVWI